MNLKKLVLRGTLIAGLGLGLGDPLAAQTFLIQHSFGNDGGELQSGLFISNNVIYGTTAFGNDWDNGTVFSVDTDGTGFVFLHDFSELSNSDEGGTNSDGANPFAGVALSGNTLFGTAKYGGSWSNGTVFAVNVVNMNFTNLHSFEPKPDGACPEAGVMLAGNRLYGTTYAGGSSGYGTIFAVNTDGTGFTNLHNFLGTSTDGGSPVAGLILSGNTLYGTTSGDNSASAGTVFAIKTNGMGFTALHRFNGNTDGEEPYAGLILSGKTLYGTTFSGGPIYGNGTIFAVNTNSTGFTNLYTFTCSTNDGCEPYGGLILAGNTLYGTTKTSYGGSVHGTIFSIHTNGTGFECLHRFFGYPTDGATPLAGLTLSGNTLYGTTYTGGSAGGGAIFSLSLAVLTQLAIVPSGASVVFTWPTNVAGFTLQSTTSLDSSMSWGAVSTAPVVVNGQNTVTNPISGTQQFYRLSQ